jgi:hypothetical protein
MASIDLKNNIAPELAVDIQAISSDTTTVGTEVDTAGFESVTFILTTGAYTDGNYTLLIEDTDTTGTGYVAVDDSFLIGTEAETTLSAANDSSRIGYVGKKQFVRASIVSDTTTTGATAGAVVLLGSALSNPVA